MSNTLFESDFPALSSKDWMDKIVKDLKGIPISKLIWKLDNNTIIDPYYTIERDRDLDAPIHNSILGQLKNSSWNIIQDLSGAGPNEIEKAKASNISIIELHESDELFNDSTVYCFVTSKQSLESIKSKYNNINILINPIDFWMLGKSKELDLHLTKENPSTIHLSSSVFHNAGADEFTELSLTLAALNEYLHYLKENSIDSKNIILNISCGINFYTSIAKLRAFRILVDQLLTNYDFTNLSFTFNASTSSYYNAHKDQYTNLLRHTTMALSAVIGGADGVNVLPFEEESSLSYRMARNIQHLIKEESYMDKVEDMMAGSYFFEELTMTFMDKSWNQFLKIEDKGGLISCMRSGYIKSILEEQHNTRVEKYRSDQATMIGVNKYTIDDVESSKSTKKSENTPDWVLPSHTLSKDI